MYLHLSTLDISPSIYRLQVPAHPAQLRLLGAGQPGLDGLLHACAVPPAGGGRGRGGAARRADRQPRVREVHRHADPQARRAEARLVK